jgi:hypothetical protein
MHALIGWFLLATWIIMLWAAFKLVQEVGSAVRDWRRTRPADSGLVRRRRPARA